VKQSTKAKTKHSKVLGSHSVHTQKRQNHEQRKQTKLKEKTNGCYSRDTISPGHLEINPADAAMQN